MSRVWVLGLSAVEIDSPPDLDIVAEFSIAGITVWSALRGESSLALVEALMRHNALLADPSWTSMVDPRSGAIAAGANLALAREGRGPKDTNL